MHGHELSGQALRQQQVEVLKSANLVHLALAIEPAVTETAPDVSPDPPFPDKYGSLARKLYVSYDEALPGLIGEQADLVNGENAVSGLDVMARILSFGPQTYADYTRAHGQSASLEELTTIMKNSYDTVNALMSMDGWTNNDYEAALALSGGNAERPRGLFTIVRTDEGPRFVATDNALRNALAKVAQRRATAQSDPEPESWQKCPARGLFGLTLWRRMVDLAAADPEMLAVDLTAALAA